VGETGIGIIYLHGNYYPSFGLSVLHFRRLSIPLPSSAVGAGKNLLRGADFRSEETVIVEHISD
jgi:hypothetical protein